MEQTTHEKHFVNRATPLSKGLALVLFIMLPLLTLYIGYQAGIEGDIVPEQVVNEEHTVENQAGYKKYVDAKYGISFDIPKDWSLLEQELFGARVVASPDYKFVGAQSVGDYDNFEGSAIKFSGTCSVNERFKEDPVAFVEFKLEGGSSEGYRLNLDGRPAAAIPYSYVQYEYTEEPDLETRSIMIHTINESCTKMISIESTTLSAGEFDSVTKRLVETFRFE